ncbi:hypothetical protein FA95DRAFT_1306443 [Auriscalpium vulgare]|uniref:Uncharacterized protein n=1 Tax=Auriscalpium vulgare TaxID=40419 RepID=A0ACB8R3B5_9AGAM|nr:hypothetical protein FA95DRAFT_1306443 [Auriscalpium vulgare]
MTPTPSSSNGAGAGADSVADERTAFFERLRQELQTNERFIANDDSDTTKKLVARAVSAVSNHRILYEQVPGKNGGPPTERVHVGFLFGQTGMHADGQRLGAAGTQQGGSKVCHDGCSALLPCSHTAITQIDDHTHVKMNVVCKALAGGQDFPEFLDFWTDQSVGLYDRACKLVGGVKAYQTLLEDRSMVRLQTPGNPRAAWLTEAGSFLRQIVRPFVREHTGNKRDVSSIGGPFNHVFLPLATTDIYSTVPVRHPPHMLPYSH